MRKLNRQDIDDCFSLAGMFFFREGNRKLLLQIIENQGEIMAAIDDLKKAVADVGNALGGLSADIQKVLAALAGSNDPAIVAAASTLEGVAAQMNTLSASIETALAPPAV